MVIRATDRVSEVLARDEGLIEVFTSVSPAFERLRRPAMRRVMSRLVTVEQAARVAGVDPDDLLARLNSVLGVKSTGTRAADEDRDLAPRPGPEIREEMEMSDLMPETLASIPEDLIVDLDVRPDLRRGEEPFSKIMAAKRRVPPGGVLRLRATFEPVPLYRVLAKQGMTNWTERFADDDWRVWFYPDPETGGATAEERGEERPDAVPREEVEEDVVILDLRGLEPPEPMVRTLAALEELPVGKTLVQINVRVPQFLLPRLEERGFTYEIREQSKDLVRIFIRHGAATTNTQS